MPKLNRRKTPRYSEHLKDMQVSLEALLAESRFLRQRIVASDEWEKTRQLRRLIKGRLPVDP